MFTASPIEDMRSEVTITVYTVQLPLKPTELTRALKSQQQICLFSVSSKAHL